LLGVSDHRKNKCLTFGKKNYINRVNRTAMVLSDLSKTAGGSMRNEGFPDIISHLKYPA